MYVTICGALGFPCQSMGTLFIPPCLGDIHSVLVYLKSKIYLFKTLIRLSKMVHKFNRRLGLGFSLHEVRSKSSCKDGAQSLPLPDRS